jgi:hypothetical protein
MVYFVENILIQSPSAAPISSSDFPIPTASSTRAFDITSLLPSYMISAGT